MIVRGSQVFSNLITYSYSTNNIFDVTDQQETEEESQFKSVTMDLEIWNLLHYIYYKQSQIVWIESLL